MDETTSMFGIQTGTKQRCFYTGKSGGTENTVRTGQDSAILTPSKPSLSLMQLNYAIHLLPSQLFFINFLSLIFNFYLFFIFKFHPSIPIT